MDEWLKQFQAMANQAARDSSQWFHEVSQQTEQAVDQLTENALETLEEIDRVIAPTANDLNHRLDQAIDDSLEIVEQQVIPWLEATTAPIVRTVNPWLQNHPTCIGCKHYHGTYYGEAMLVCAMHPYGPEAEHCPDWESAWEVS